MPAAMIDPEDLIVPLASAHGDLDVVHQLIKGQYGKRLLQLRKIIDRGIGASPAAVDASRLPEWYALLVDVQRAAPEVLRSVLLDPDVAVWFESRGGDPGVVGLIAAAAAIRASLPATVVVPVEDGKLFVPGLGAVIVGDASGDAVVHVTADGVTVAAGDAEITLPHDLGRPADRWRPVRWLRAGEEAKLKVRFAVDGPLSDAFGTLFPADSPTPYSEGDWQRALIDAWQVLETGHPVHAASIAAGVRALVPVPPCGDGGSASATLEAVFGAIALSLPTRPEGFAVALVHELQHAKLAATLDLIQLYRADDEARYYAPWRPDPRPLGALLQGVYAHLGVAQFWGVQGRLADAEDSMLPLVEFVRWRDDTWQACKELMGAPSLTAAGDVFVSKIFDELNRLRAEEVQPEARRIADLIGRDHRVSWRLCNFDVDQVAARRLAEAWLNDKNPFAFPAQCVRRRQTPRTVPGKRIQLVYRYLNGNIEEAQEGSPGADVLYARGNYRDALDAYERRVTENPADLDAWAGITLSTSAQNHTALDFLSATPEVAAEVYRQAASISPAPKPPLRLAEWLNGAA